MLNLDFSNSRLLVIGDVMMDRYWKGSVLRISPEAPVPIVKVEDEEVRVGGAGNVAINAAALGASISLLGLVGSDSAADQIEQMLKKNKIHCHLQRVNGKNSLIKLRVISQNQQLIRLDFEDQFTELNSVDLLSNFVQNLDQVDVVVLSDYAKGTLYDPSKLIHIAREAGKIVIVDPKGNDFFKYRGASILTPNLAEFESIVGICESDTIIEKRGIELRDELELEAILITRSQKGMTLLERGQNPIHLPTRAKDVFDVTGAGDTVVATLGVAIASNIRLYEAVNLANSAAGIVVSKLGTSSVTISELQKILF
jgi:D-beta-D-heptose 7-phosphate kinase/D-beta-D-heptose 1-phosphate adenosyltransferase